ncbi:MAG: hypothetical protein KJ061_16380 [Vicinamibacteraceae bacterium]|nr:hypothetical protein [Vicinamibacteraceae bacterium]
MKHAGKIIRTALTVLLLCLTDSASSPAQAQTDYRFGTADASGAQHLGMLWYRDYNDSIDHPPPAHLRKLWTVGKIDGRTDYAALGLDTRLPDGTPIPFEWVWPLLGLIDADPSLPRTREAVNVMAPLVSTLVSTYLAPKVVGTWAETTDSIEDVWEDAAHTDVCLWRPFKKCAYRVYSRNPSVSLSDSLSLVFTPGVRLVDDTVLELGEFKVSFNTDWHFDLSDNKGIVTGTPRIRTTIELRLTVALGFEDEVGAWFFVRIVPPSFEHPGTAHGRRVFHSGTPVVTVTSATLGHTKWRALGIKFTSKKLDRKVMDEVDTEVRKAIRELLGTLDVNSNGVPDLSEELVVKRVLGQYLFGGAWAPSQDEVLRRIYDREQSKIAAAIAGGVVGQNWEVANEPNWFPYLTPLQYARHYVRYYDLITGLDPDARLLHGGLFVKEFVDDPATLVADRFDLDVAGVDLARLLNVLYQAETTAAWFSAFRAWLPPRFEVPVGNLHVYPLGASDPRHSPEAFAAVLGASVNAMRAAGAGEVWVTEFGNLDPRAVEDDVAMLAAGMVEGLRCQPDVTKWFWFTSEPFEFLGVPVMSNLLRPSGGALVPTQVGLTYQRFFQLGTFVCEADVDDNSCVDLADVATVFAAAGGQPMPHPLEAYDLDRDGVVGAGDVARVRALFTNSGGAPCR